MMAIDFDISPLAAEFVLQSLQAVVHEHQNIEASGESFDELAYRRRRS